MNPADVGRQLCSAIDARDWAALRSLLADDCRVEYCHDGKVFGPDAWVAFNADYPGVWTFTLDDLVADAGRVVVRARTQDSSMTFHVASFLTVTDGLVSEIVEVWTDGLPNPSEER
ncbi:hypothetical protein BJ980_002087 [Nocardioides daedukensis]|uniref:SnoaL-like domain-containing protein n=1 Tax=Nocardioides daedukensis TaxID=634462 RepID=A0A7Y9S1C3_9ACTN|nr:hypothetical protein [Nocardioides daedukensis]